MPPAPSTLVEEGREFWRRYPLEYQQGFKGEAVLSVLHRRMLRQRYFPVVGSVPKAFVARNRRAVDIHVAQFENETQKDIDRSGWGLPKPNREAAYLSLAKYAKDVPALDAKQVMAFNGAVDWLHRHFGPHMQNSRVKSQEEVVTGLDMSTSPGYPWTRKYADKRAMYDDWKGFTQYMEDDWDRLKDEDYVAIFGNSLKEEIRPQEKIDANSIRTFTAGPVEMTIHGNRLFEDMNEKFYASHLQTASAVGFSPWKGGWDELYRKLRKHRNGFALDESQYDSSLRAYMMWAIAEFRWSMLRIEDQTLENLRRLQVYYRNLINTVIITSDGVFVMKQGGNPSGSVNTIVDNTLILFLLLAFAWQMISPSEKRSYECFMDDLSLALVGDDNTWTVSDVAVQFFNARSVIKEWARIGVTTTTDCEDPRPVEQLDFLSAFTVFIDGVAVPIYNRQKLLTSLLYSRSPGDPAYTLVRAAALLRVGWADLQMRGYLRELISWLVAEYGFVLRDSKEWRDALAQVPLESELKLFYLGHEGVQFPFENQGKARIIPEKATALPYPNGQPPGIKSRFSEWVMSSIALPQRSRARRQPRRQNSPQALAMRKRQPRARRARRSRRGQARGRPRTQGRRNGALVGARGRRSRRRVSSAVMGSGGGGVLMSAKRVFGNSFNASRGARVKVVENDEFIGAVNGSVAFAVTSFACNPGNSTTFPWLAVESTQWEKYVFEYLEFYYEHEVSEFATNGTTGKVIMSFDYDAADQPPTSKQQMENSDPHMDMMPCEDAVLVMDPEQLCGRADEHYVRRGNVPGGADIRFYDVGNFNIATQGCVNTSEVGELHVRYRCRFEVPVLESTTAVPANNQVSWFQSTTGEAMTTTVDKTLALATATTNGLNIVNTAGSMVPPAGNYLILWQLGGNDTSAETNALDCDIKKNGTSVYTAATPYGVNSAGSGTAMDCAVSGSVFVTANGTDAFTMIGNYTGAAGTLTGFGSAVWVAV